MKIEKNIKDYFLNKIKDDFLNKIIERSIESYNKKDNFFTKEEKIGFTLSYNSILELRDKNTKDVTLNLIYGEEFDEILNSKFDNFAIRKKEDIKNNDVKIFSMPDNEINIVSKKIINILENNELEDKKEALYNMLKKKYEEYKPLEINDKKMEKVQNFANTLEIFENAINDFSFQSGTRTKYETKMIKVNGEEHYHLKFFDNNKNKIEINAKSLTDFKDKIVDFLEKHLVKDEKYYYEKKLENLEKLKNVDINNMKANLNKDFSFEFTNKLDDGYKQLLRVKTDKEIYTKINFKHNNINELAFALLDDDYTKMLDKRERGYTTIIRERVDYLKEKNTDIMKQIDKNINNETLKEVNGDILYHSLSNSYRSGNNGTLTYLSDNLDIVYQNRIENLKNKEEFVEKNHKEFGLTLNSEGKISELYDGNDDDYTNKIDEILNNNKENLYEKIVEDFENMREIAKKEYAGKQGYSDKFNYDSETYSLLIEEYKKEKTETIDLQKKFIENSIPILLTENKMGLTKSAMSNLENLPDVKDKLFERMDNYYKSSSETLKGTADKDFFKKKCDIFIPEKFDTFSLDGKIVIPKEKKNIKEKELTKENEKEMDM